MDQDVANIMLEHLKHLRKGQDAMMNDIRDMKFRLGQLEETSVHHSSRFDRIEDRLERIEKRLDLVDAR